MAEPASQLERIVLEVLAEMGLAPGTGSLAARGSQGTGGQPAGGAPPTGAAAGDLVVERRIVTLAELPQRLDGIRRVVVPPGAVLTPSVRDVLHRNRLTLAFGTPETPAMAGSLTAVVVAVGAKHDPALLVKALAGEGFAVQSRRMDCLIAATDQLAGDLRPGGTLGLLLTGHTAAALCLANRLPGVRAVRAATVEGVTADVEAVGANLLVIDPLAQGFFPTRQMALRFLRTGPRACPEVFRQRLS